MRFKQKSKAQLGDIRTITRFAWKPILIEDTTVWLEYYVVHQKFGTFKVINGNAKIVNEWVDVYYNLANYY